MLTAYAGNVHSHFLLQMFVASRLLCHRDLPPCFSVCNNPASLFSCRQQPTFPVQLHVIHMLSLQGAVASLSKSPEHPIKACCMCACFLLTLLQPQIGQSWVSVQRRVKVEPYSSFLFAVTKIISSVVVGSVMPHSDPYSKKD